jgi:hypothetical protein
MQNQNTDPNNFNICKEPFPKEKAEECRAKDPISPIKDDTSAKRNNLANRFQTTLERPDQYWTQN